MGNVRKPKQQRRDATGHLDRRYAAGLRMHSLEHVRPDDVAFLARARSKDSLADTLGREFLQSATMGEDSALEALNRGMPEEDGGPFVVTRGKDEFARGSDESN